MSHGGDLELKSWIRRHRVSWEVTPHFEVEGHRKRLVALDLCLAAAPSPRCSGSPGCAECARVYARLCRLAKDVLPEGSDHHLGPFDGTFHLRPENDWRPELLLEVELRGEAHSASAEADRAVLAAVGARLRALGAQQGLWRDPRIAA